MYLAKKTLWVFFFLMPLLILNTENVFANFTDDDIPEVTAKVARISFLRGDVQIRRAGSEDWERAVQNLPIVEGDEIATEANARLEIQFDTYRFLRLDENAYLTFTSLRDEGIAVSLPQGSLSVRILEFDDDSGFFEIDAPKTTIAVQRAGMYRVDAGSKDDAEIRVTVTNDGEARIYSESSGLTLRDGRSAKIYIAGDLTGEWDIEDASRYIDNFDKWALDRDLIIAKRLRDANYDKYYDRDFYGAEELNENGEWIFSRDYGYVWRPYQNVISQYADWSPYRYGHWRWLPVYGWTWVNDEPWGWATYHHGRWVYYNGYWVWSPYGQHRPRRSWWRPALVVITYIGNSICWYPLPYGYGYYNYNRRYRRNYSGGGNYNNNPNPNPTPNPTPTPGGGDTGSVEFQMKDRRNQVPRTGIVAVDASEFGRGKRDYRIPTQMTANEVFSKVPDDRQSPPLLPTFKELNGKVSPDILIQNTQTTKVEPQVKTGATVRTGGVPLDEKLREQRVFGDRTPTPRTTNSVETKNNSDTNSNTRGTGAVVRPQPSVTKQNSGNNGNSETPQTKTDSPVVRPRNETRNDSPPIYTPPVRKESPPRQERQPEQRVETPRPRPEPRVESKPSPPPPPPRSEPRSEPKSEPKREESKPSPPPEERKGKP